MKPTDIDRLNRLVAEQQLDRTLTNRAASDIARLQNRVHSIEVSQSRFIDRDKLDELLEPMCKDLRALRSVSDRRAWFPPLMTAIVTSVLVALVVSQLIPK